MKILLVLMQHDYGVETRGASYEYTNIFLPTEALYGAENVLLFDFMAEFKKSGKEAMNSRLLSEAKSFSPDIALFCLYENEIAEKTLTALNTFTRTTVYFFDDPWRQSFVRHWIKYFRFFSTPDYYMYQQYTLEGINNVVFSPFGYNKEVYKKLDLNLKYEVTFVGGYSSYRKWIISTLRKAGLEVHVFGRGWQGDNRWISTPEMVNIFNQSYINLNLSNGISYNLFHILHSLSSLSAMKQILHNRKIKEQVKGRHYEINGCGGFQISYFVPGLNLAYEIDKEIVVYEDPSLLAAQIKFFLNNNSLRQKIADAGHNRSLSDHSAQGYLKNLYMRILELSL